MDKLTEKEEEFLGILFQIADVIIKGAGEYFDMDSYETFSRKDLFNLAIKLGVENKY